MAYAAEIGAAIDEEVAGATIDARGAVRRGRAATPPRGRLLVAPAGLGKSTIAGEVAATRVRPALLLAPTKVATAVMGEAARAAAPPERTVDDHPPRRDLVGEEKRTGEWGRGACGLYPIAVVPTGDAHHLIAPTLCRHCPYGWAWAVETGTASLETAKLLADWAWEHGVPPSAVPTCGYLAGCDDAWKAEVLLATTTAYSPQMADRRSDPAADGEDPTPRLTRRATVHDEGPTYVVARTWGAADVLRWLGDAKIVAEARAEALSARERDYRAWLAEAGRGDDTSADLWEHELDDLRWPRDLAMAACHWLERLHGEAIRTHPRPRRVAVCIRRLGLLALSLPVPGIAAMWEAVKLDAELKASAPLRVILEAAANLPAGGLIVMAGAEPGGAHITTFAFTAIGDAVVRRGEPVMVQDATPSRLHRDLAITRGWEIDRIELPSVDAEWISGRNHGRGARRGREERALREGGEVAQMLRVAKAERGRPQAVIPHKPVADVLRDGRLADPALIYHWGAHRSTNDLAGVDLHVFGALSMPDHAWHEKYVAERIAALVGGLDPEHWPEWDGQFALVDGAHVPSNPVVREWRDDIRAAELVQALMRARPHQHPDVHLTYRGPWLDLRRFGMRLMEHHAESAADAAVRRNELKGAKRDEVMAAIAARKERAGDRVTRDALEAVLLIERAADRLVPGRTHRRYTRLLDRKRVLGSWAAVHDEAARRRRDLEEKLGLEVEAVRGERRTLWRLIPRGWRRPVTPDGTTAPPSARPGAVELASTRHERAG